MPDHIDAHALCTRNRKLLEERDRCGCFYCMNIFHPKEIIDWLDGEETALCPRCGIDSVIYETEEYPLTVEFLKKMNEYWF